MKNGVLDSQAIGSLDVVIGKEALSKYGEAAKSGAIILTLMSFRKLNLFLCCSWDYMSKYSLRNYI
jgi:hypothetical protein